MPREPKQHEDFIPTQLPALVEKLGVAIYQDNVMTEESSRQGDLYRIDGQSVPSCHVDDKGEGGNRV